jgi:Domain of unknown function (DUF397)
VAFGEHVRSDRGIGDDVTWRKSSFSAMNGNCVEVAELRGGMIGVRDTKDGGAGPVLLFEQTAWRSFIGGLKATGSLL